MLKNMTQEKFLKRYEKYDAAVQEYMEIISDALIEKYQDIPDIFVLTLDALAGNLTIMHKAMEAIAVEGGDIKGKDNYRGEKKSTELSAFLASQNNVIKLANIFGFTPMGKSKIRENTDAADVNKYLQNLIS